MPTFTTKIQKVHFFHDQYKELGEVDLAGAMAIFKEFPFADQLREYAGKKSLDFFNIDYI
ncbi:MAG: hypothetical protein KKA07_08495 [Bacteroidetes bacterium]|nr:hypothetical protein [Bacteroidota bacterium]MBU1719100.1 hypothetical protein [Bacteroidota bacterium]